MFARTSTCFLLLAILAGCSSAPGAPSDGADRTSTPGADSVAAAADAPVVESKAGHLDAGVGADTPVGPCWAEVGADRVLEFTVPDGTAQLVLELAWNDTVQDLTLVASPPGTPSTPCPPAMVVDKGFTGSPDAPTRLVVQAPAAGHWMLGAQANGAVVSTIQYMLYATVAPHALDPAYTAIPMA